MEGRSPMEAGSPEFAEDRTQINSLNNKFCFDQTMEHQFTAAKRSQEHFDQLNSRLMASLDESLNLQKKVNGEYFETKNRLEIELATIRAQGRRWADDNAYVTRYDLSNPIATSAADSLRANAAPTNRAVDADQAATTGVVGVSEGAIAAAVAKQVDATVTPILGVLQQMLAEITASTTASKAAVASIANVLSQVQPKTVPAT